MRSVSEFSDIFLCREVVDMRKSINGLSVMAQEELGADWSKSQLFVFCNRRRTLLKILYFDRSGFALWIKRLEESKFPWPKEVDEERVSMTSSDLKLLLSGINIWTRFKKLEYERVF